MNINTYNTQAMDQQHQHHHRMNTFGKRSFMMIQRPQQQQRRHRPVEDQLGWKSPSASSNFNPVRALQPKPTVTNQFDDAMEEADATQYMKKDSKASSTIAASSSPTTTVVPLPPSTKLEVDDDEREKMLIAEVIIQMGNNDKNNQKPSATATAAAVSDDDHSISSALTLQNIPPSPTKSNAMMIVGRERGGAATSASTAAMIPTIPTSSSSSLDNNNGKNGNKINLLEALQLSLHNPKWIENYYHLKAYRDQNGHCYVPPSLTNDGSSYSQLASWLTEQRAAFVANKLPSHYKQLLDDLGIVWPTVANSKPKPKKKNGGNPQGAFSDTKWFGHYKNLVEYQKIHGHCNVPQHDEGKLGPWVKRQREEYKKGKLCKHRLDLLSDLGFVWKMPRSAPFDNTRWLQKFSELKTYKLSNGHCNVPTREGKLGMWVNRQRSENSKGKMRPDRKQMLDSIGFAWTTGRYHASSNP